MELRPYQQQFVSDVYSQIRAGEKRILGVAPTGAGKTIISSKIAADAASRGKRVLFGVHRDILVKQTYDKFKQFSLECGFIKSGWPENRNALVQIASVQTMSSRDWWQSWPADLCILDECHITAFNAVIKNMMEKFHPKSLYLGITATPWRLKSTEGMGDIFNSLVCAPMPEELIDQGFLVKPSYYGVDLNDTERLEIGSDGDYLTRSLAIAYDQPEIIAQCVSEWKRLASARKTIVFAVDVAHSKHISKAFNAAGIPSAHVDGKISYRKREKLYQQLAQGKILVLCSCLALTEGFDVPSVEVVVQFRKTLSKALHTQMVGRMLRLSPSTGKTDGLVIDLVGNVARHGFIEDILDIQLTKGREPKNAPPPSTKICPVDDGGCGAILYAFQMVCPKCKYNFEAHRLTSILGLKRMLRPSDVERLNLYRQLLFQAYELNMAPSWAAVRFKDQFKHYPPLDWGRGAVFGETPTDVQFHHYRKHLAAIASRLGKDSNWIEKYLQLEFADFKTCQVS